jgi:hypothetical protein
MNRKGATITGYILKEMADKFWDTLPQYSSLERPRWSDGWLTAFKQRHHIKQIEYSSRSSLQSSETSSLITLSMISIIWTKLAYFRSCCQIGRSPQSSYLVRSFIKSESQSHSAVTPLAHTSLILGSFITDKRLAASAVRALTLRLYYLNGE